MGWSRPSVSPRIIIISVLALAVALSVGVIIGWFSHTYNAPTLYTRAADQSITQKIFANIVADNIRSNLKAYTAYHHMAGTAGEAKLTDLIEATWQGQGLDLVTRRSYDVLLSYPNTSDPNTVQIIDSQNKTIFQSTIYEKVLQADENETDSVPPFHAYSPSGDVTGDMVYAHSATDEDFKLLRDYYKINFTGKIILARYGASYRGAKVRLAQVYGAAAILLYLDPYDYPSPDGKVFPYSRDIPGTAVQRGTVLLGDSDPLTPGYPSTESAYRISQVNNSFLPTIPSHPISYEDAYVLLKALGGTVAPDSWQGGLNFTYHIGPGFANASWKTHVHVTTKNQQVNVTSLFGFINGTLEPDRYVLLGNHRDAWTLGGVDPTSATALMVELSRVFMQLVKEGWRPRRTIIFCSWGAEEYGLIGSYEWVEDYVKLLTGRAVAYLNIDYTLDGEASLTIGAMPTLHDVIYNAAKKVTSPNYPNKTVYDDWLQVFPSPITPGRPEIDPLGDSSDFSGFMMAAGISCYDAWYTSRQNNGYALYHTSYEGFTLYDLFLDPNYKIGVAMGQFWGETVRDLADSLILPLNMSNYASLLITYINQLNDGYGQLMRNNSISLDVLQIVAVEFQQAADDFHRRVASLDTTNPYAVRGANDQMMNVDRAFIDPAGLPLRPHFRHVVFAPSVFNSYTGSVFPGLTDLMFEIDLQPDPPGQWEQVRQHLAAIIFCFQSAAAAIKPVTGFIYT